MQKVGEWWKGEGRGAEGRRVVEMEGEGCRREESGGKGRGGVQKVGEWWKGKGRGAEGRRVVERGGEGCRR